MFCVLHSGKDKGKQAYYIFLSSSVWQLEAEISSLLPKYTTILDSAESGHFVLIS